MSQRAPISRRRLLGYVAVGAASTATTGLPGRAATDPAVGAEPGPMAAATVSSAPSQIMQAFGASGAWWPNDLVRFDPGVREAVADTLFGPDGLALSVYPYNIGDGGVEVTDPVRAPGAFLVAPGTEPAGRSTCASAFTGDI